MTNQVNLEVHSHSAYRLISCVSVSTPISIMLQKLFHFLYKYISAPGILGISLGSHLVVPPRVYSTYPQNLSEQYKIYKQDIQRG